MRNLINARETALSVSVWVAIVLSMVITIFYLDIEKFVPSIIEGGIALPSLFWPLTETPRIGIWNIVWIVPLIIFEITHFSKMYSSLSKSNKKWEIANIQFFGIFGGILAGIFWGFVGNFFPISPMIFVVAFTPFSALAATALYPKGGVSNSITPTVVMTTSTAVVSVWWCKRVGSTEILPILEIVLFAFLLNVLVNTVRPFLFAVAYQLRAIRFALKKKKRAKRMEMTAKQ